MNREKRARRTHPERGELDIAVLLHVPLHKNETNPISQQKPLLLAARARRGGEAGRVTNLGEVDIEEEWLLGVGHLDAVAAAPGRPPLRPLTTTSRRRRRRRAGRRRRARAVTIAASASETARAEERSQARQALFLRCCRFLTRCRRRHGCRSRRTW